MNWDSTFLTTKVFVFIALGFVLSVANAAVTVMGSVLMFIILTQGGHPNLALVAAILAAFSLYASGTAGRSYVMTVTLPDLFFTKAELGEIDRVGTEYEESQKDDE